MDVGQAGEFGLIARITAKLGGGPSVPLGPGDDAAVVAAPDGRVVASTDALVAGRHFRQDWASPVDIGHRAAAANLADIVAMGATPTALLVAFCLPADLALEWVEGLVEGIVAEAAQVGAWVVGGDVTASPTLTIAVTALGDLAGAAPVTRSGARSGDLVALAGRVGHAAAGYTVLSRGFRSPKLLVDAYRRPRVPYRAGLAAAGLGATAMIDVSDGLLADVGHLAEVSGLGVDLRRDAFVVSEPLRNTAEALGVDPYHWILTGGDDHSLVATFPAGTPLPDDWRVIGETHPGTGVTVDGHPYPGAQGWDHFRGVGASGGGASRPSLPRSHRGRGSDTGPRRAAGTGG